MFTPEVEPDLDDGEIRALLTTGFGADGQGYFRGMCDRLHVYVTKGEGARILVPPGRAQPPQST